MTRPDEPFWHWEWWEKMLPPEPPAPAPEPPRPTLWQIEKQINRLGKQVAKLTGQRS